MLNAMVEMAVRAVNVDERRLCMIRAVASIIESNVELFRHDGIATNGGGGKEAEESTSQACCKVPKAMSNAMLMPILNSILNDIIDQRTSCNGGGAIEFCIVWHLFKDTCDSGPTV